MKRSIEKTIALFVSLIIAFSFLSTVFVYASFNTGANNAKTAEQNNTEEYVDKKVYSEATILDDFADDSILIVLSKKETWDFSQYSVKVATYTFTTTTELVMRLSSEVDTFLYIIDPRSSEYCYEIEDIDDLYADLYPSLCNDNYFVDFTYTSNSRIRKTFDANVPYLIVFCAYNPSSPSSVGSFYVDFE